MPTYEYYCDECRQSSEIFQPMTAEPVKACPKCGSARFHKLISGGAGIIFKGTGFYCTDYKNASSSPSTPSTSSK